jgi:hypothetical protein
MAGKWPSQVCPMTTGWQHWDLFQNISLVFPSGKLCPWLCICKVYVWKATGIAEHIYVTMQHVIFIPQKQVKYWHLRIGFTSPVWKILALPITYGHCCGVLLIQHILHVSNVSYNCRLTTKCKWQELEFSFISAINSFLQNSVLYEADDVCQCATET